METICFGNRLRSQIPVIIITQLLVNFLVLSKLRTDDSCCIDLLSYPCLTLHKQFRQHYARDKRNANLDHYFWYKSFLV